MSRQKPDTTASALFYINVAEQTKSDVVVFFDESINAIPIEIRKLTWLKSLYVYNTQISDLTHVGHLPNLELLDIRNTKVASLAPLAGLTRLEELRCDRTRIDSLRALRGLKRLRQIECSECNITDEAEFLRRMPALRYLYLDPGANGSLGSVPPELLTPGNCLARVRQYYDSLDSGRVEVTSVKLFLYGNGQIGKTQLARQLDPPASGKAYDPRVTTTHGVQVRRFDLSDRRRGGTPFQLRLWDFGGQDLYHGAHALFLRDRAIHMVCWAAADEAGSRRDIHGYLSRNQPVEYWLSFARNHGGHRSALVVAQTKVDTADQEKDWSAAARERIAHGLGGFVRFVAVSAKTGRGIGPLKSTLAAACRWLLNNHSRTFISRDWADVSDFLEALRRQDAQLAKDERRYRAITTRRFVQICDYFGMRARYEALLHYLNGTGALFWDDELLPDKIILDQEWALDAIYAIFDRAQCVYRLRLARGRFTPADLSAWLWDEQEHSPTDQLLFVQFMLSCRICFPYKGEGDESVYIAPDALPDKPALSDTLELGWDEDWPGKETELHYALLHDGLLRGLMCEIGAQAGMCATYWRDGLQLFDRDSHCRLRIGQERQEVWAGLIRIQVQWPPDNRVFDKDNQDPGLDPADEADGGPPWSFPDKLLRRIVALIEKEEARCGLESDSEAAEFRSTGRRDGRAAVDSLQADTDPNARRGFFISYAWGDDTDPGRKREAVVNDFVVETEKRGVKVNIDRDAIRIGDSISAYMDRLAHGDRIFVFVSHKYLRSVACMNELVSAWRYSNRSWCEFEQRVRFYVLDDADLYSADDRAMIKEFWHEKWLSMKTRHEKIDPLIMSKLESAEKKEIDLLGRILDSVYSLLQEVADHVHQPNFEAFCEGSLRDLMK